MIGVGADFKEFFFLIDDAMMNFLSYNREGFFDLIGCNLHHKDDEKAPFRSIHTSIKVRLYKGLFALVIKPESNNFSLD